MGDLHFSRFQIIQFVLVQGPHFENQCPMLVLPWPLVIKHLTATQEMPKIRAGSLGQEDPLEEEMTTNSSILARKTPRTEERGGLQSMGSY